jgi:hypothetical protein
MVVFVFTVMVAPAVVVSLMLAVPAVIMLEAPTISVPVTVVVPAPFPTRSDPGCAAVRGKSPIAPVPTVAAIYHVPIAVNPHIAGARSYWPDAQHTRRRWSADSYSDGYLSFKRGRAGQKHRGKQRCANELSHVLSSLKDVF